MGASALLERLEKGEVLGGAQYKELIAMDESIDEVLFERARDVCAAHFGPKVFIRGLIEITSYCKNDCLYCGLRARNGKAERYRLTDEEILECCAEGHALGFRTFVLQGGEDPAMTDERLVGLVRAIRRAHPDCAITLSLGERSMDSYLALRQAGADRYLLRHETADQAHYASLHPARMSFEARMNCLRALKSLGYQAGCGFMVGSPGQTADCLAEDLCFLRDFQPQMVGIGPFIAHADTPFRACASGSAGLTLRMLALTRLLLPGALLPSTTALNTLADDGRNRGIRAGANVVMLNLSPASVRAKYNLYARKAQTDPAEGLSELVQAMEKIGRCVAVERGDAPDWPGAGRRAEEARP